MSSAIISTYKRLPVEFTHGKGIELFDTNGRRYVDALSGIAVCGLGHAHPKVAQAIAEQASKLVHTSNLYGIPLQERLADELSELSGMRAAFLCNSGAEANEAAIKVARAYGHKKGIELPEILVVDGSFHGRTLATLSATGNRKVHMGFEPLVSGFVRVPYNDIESVRSVAASRPNAVAMLVEPILGEGGVVVPADGYLKSLREICDAQGWLLMLDEIQTGMGRTGRWFAHQHEHITPDVMTLAKALGNGVPIGACLVAAAAHEVLGPGSHGSTFGGNPLACSAALATIATMREEGVVENAARMGDRLMSALRQSLESVNCVNEVRGKGLMIGIEMASPCAELVERALADGLLINVTADNVVRLLPPLILNETQVDELASKLCEIIKSWNSGKTT